MNGEFESAFREMLTSVAVEAASEAIRQQRLLDEEQSRDGNGDRFLLRSHEAAERLAISTASLNRLTRSGELPCVRVGRMIRYSTETLREWIKRTESTDLSEPRPKVARNNLVSTSSPPQSKKTELKKTPKRAQPKKKASSTGTEPKKKSIKVRRKQTAETESNERLNPFGLLLKEIGVERKNFATITNGELMRIAEVDIAAFHGWMYMNRELPEEALQKLRDHFGGYRTN